MGLVGVSSGTAAALGLKKTKNDTLPTTAYLLLGTGCKNSCRFCPQGTQESGQRNFLSRITWPRYEWEVVFNRIIKSAGEGKIKRVCFQVTDSPGNLGKLKTYGKALIDAGIAVNSSCVVENKEIARDLISTGFEKISLALDAVNPELFRKIKGRDWNQTWNCLQKLNNAYPGRISTHLIVGMGETQQELLEILFKLLNMGVTVGLFAFTPIKGTPMASQKQPPVDYYRKVQVARHLLSEGKLAYDRLNFSEGKLIDWGLSAEKVVEMLAPHYYQTPGCKDCNRPYYNESPGGEMYNYPRPLTFTEYKNAVIQTFKETAQEGTLDEEKILATYNR